MAKGNEDDGTRRRGHEHERQWQEYERFKLRKMSMRVKKMSGFYVEIRILQQ